jgi:hypothetical protein
MADTAVDTKVTPALAENELEAGDSYSQDRVSTDDPRQDLPLWRWIVTLVGLYFGALLYG